MHIAVIEEERSIQDMVRHALELGGHQVDIYSEPPEQLNPYDLVIIEPGEHGQALPTILHFMDLYHFPVLILTFYDWNIDLAQKQHLPLLRKMPFRLMQLLEMVEGVDTLSA